MQGCIWCDSSSISFSEVDEVVENMTGVGPVDDRVLREVFAVLRLVNGYVILGWHILVK